MSSNSSRNPDFMSHKFVIGVVHLLPLPGSPSFDGDVRAIFDRALEDASALKNGGVDGIIVENLGDAPFTGGHVRPHVVAFMAVIARRISDEFGLPIGINVLRNDGVSAIAVAAAANARFIRINVLTGAMVTDQGIIQGNAYEVLRYRREIGFDEGIAIFADVAVKHAYPLGYGYDLVQAAKDTYGRGGADALILTGAATGAPTSPEDLKTLREAMPEAPIIIGSGVTPENIKLLSCADGFIVGTYFKKDGIVTNPVDEERVRKLVDAVKNLD